MTTRNHMTLARRIAGYAAQRGIHLPNDGTARKADPLTARQRRRADRKLYRAKRRGLEK